MSEYVKAGLGDSSLPPGNYSWVGGKCKNTQTGVVYAGIKKASNCNTDDNSSGGWGDVFDFAKGQFFGGGGSAVTGPQAPASASLTSSGILIPVVAAVGGLALLLIIAKKK